MKKALKITTAVVGILFPIITAMPAAAATEGWVQSGSKWYYYSAGQALKNSWARDSKGWTFLNAVDGSWLQEGWARDSRGWCYIKNGYWLDHAAWVTDSSGWQYIGADGYWNSAVPVQAINPIDAAASAVARAEITKFPEDIQSASAKVNALSNDLSEKAPLLSRLSAITIAKEDYDNTFNYNAIDDLILDNNTTVKENQNTIDKLNINYDSLSDAKDQIDDSISAMNSLVNSMKNIPAYQHIDGSGDVVDGINAIYDNLNLQNSSNLAVMQGNVKSLESQMDSIDQQKSDLTANIRNMTAQFQMVNDQLVSSAENLILSYKSLELEEKKADENLISLKENLEMTKLYQSQGLATASDVNKIQLSIDSLNYTKSNVERQKLNIKRQLNLMIGEPYDDTAEIVFDTSLVDSLNISGIDQEYDMDKAMDNNYNARLQRYEISSCQKALDRADDSGDSNAYDAAELDLKNAQMKYDDVVRAEKLKVTQCYEDLLDKQQALDIEKGKLDQEKTTLDTVTLKYNLGMVSKKTFDDEQAAYQLQTLAVETAKTNLFTGYRKYQWILKGLTS